jgi:hypothetical protein
VPSEVCPSVDGPPNLPSVAILPGDPQ